MQVAGSVVVVTGRAGTLAPERRGGGDPPEAVAEVVLGLVESGEEGARVGPGGPPAR